MAMNGKLKSYLPYLAIVGVMVTLLTFAAKWGSTTEKVLALERNQEKVEKRIMYEFQKMRTEQKQWRARDTEDRKRQEKLMQKMYDKMMED